MSILYINHLKKRSNRLQYYLLLSLFLFSIILIYSPVLFEIGEQHLVGYRLNLKWLCHQKLERFFSFNGYYPMACARDTGILLFIFIGLFFRLPSFKKIAFIVVPIFLIEKLLEHVFMVPISNEIRFVVGCGIGLIFASMIGMYFMRVKI